MTGTKTAGFTLIEVLVSLGLFTFVLLLVASTYGHFVQSERYGIHQQEMQEDMRLVTQLLNREIRTGYGNTYQTTDGNNLFLINQNGICAHYFTDPTELNPQLYREEQKPNTSVLDNNCINADYSDRLIMTDAASTTINRLKFYAKAAEPVPNSLKRILRTQGFVSFYIEATALENPAPIIFQSTVTSRQIRSN